MGKVVAKTFQEILDEAEHRLQKAQEGVEVNRIAENLITKLTDAEFASLWIFDEERGLLFRERDDTSLNEISILEQQGIIARSFLTMSGGIYNYLASEKEYVARFDNPDGIRIKSKMIVPLVDGERFLGLATAYTSVRRIRNFNDEDLKILEALAPFLFEAIYKIRPDLRPKRSKSDKSANRLKEKTEEISQRVETLKESKAAPEEPDALLSFLANTVHDIRTPANSLAGFLELLEERIDDARILQFVRNARESAEFINELTSSILDGVAIKDGKRDQRIIINPIKFFTDIAAGFSAVMFDKRLTYNVFLDPSLPSEIRVDAFRLKRVLMNLLSNALKFTPRGKSISLTVEYDPSNKRMSISVQDQGIGIAEENQQKIFEAFTQAEEDTALHYGGTGLGLNISARYVSELGGTLRLKSKLEKGSRFYFDIPVEIVEELPRFPILATLPEHVEILMDDSHGDIVRNIRAYFEKFRLHPDKVREVKTYEELSKTLTHLIVFSSLADSDKLNSLRAQGVEILIIEEELFALTKEPAFSGYTVVSPYTTYLADLYDFLSRSGIWNKRGKGYLERKALVVDDNRVNIELLRAILEDELYRVETATSGEEGLEMLLRASRQGEPFCVAFVDRHLPGMSGTEMIERFRSSEKSQEVKLYAVSITGDPLEDSKGTELFDQAMHKPFKKQEVKDILSNMKL